MTDDYSYDMKSVEEDAEMAKRVARHSFVPAQGIEEGGDDEVRSTFQTEQSEEDYQLYGPRCLNPTPETEKALKLYLVDNAITNLKLKIPTWNYLSITTAFSTGAGSSIMKYCQTQDLSETLVTGLSVAAISGLGIKAFNYFKNELPLKKLQKQRDKLSKLEK